MNTAEEHTRDSSPLKVILPITGMIALIGYLAASSTDGTDRMALFQVGLVIGVVVYLLTFIDILLGLALIVASIAFSPDLNIGGLDSFRLEDFVLPAVLLAWIGRMTRNREELPALQIRGPAILLGVAMVLSTLFGLLAHGTSGTRAFVIMGKTLEYFLFFVAVVANVRSQEQLKAIVHFSILMAVASGLFGLGGGDARTHGPQGETATIFGGYLVMHIAVAVGLFTHAQSGPPRFLYAAAIAALGITLSFTLSRTSYMAVLVAVAVFAVLKERRLLVLLLVGTVLFLILSPDTVYERAATVTSILVSKGPPSWEARVFAWLHVLREIPVSPVFGFGVGAINLGDVDNEYFRALYDTGLVGAGLLSWLLIRIGRRANETYEALEPGTFVKGFAAGYLILFLATVVHCVGATSLTAIRTAETFMVFTGLMVCLYNNREAWGLGRRKQPTAWAAGLMEPPDPASLRPLHTR